MLTLALLVALLAMVAAPKAISLAINEDAVDDLIALLPTGPDLRLEVDKGPLRRGWFTSSGTLNLNYSIAALAPIRIILDFNISHGPLLFTENGLKFGLAHAKVYPKISYSEPILNLSQSSKQLDMDMSVFADFSRSLNLDFSLSPLDETFQDSAVSFAGFVGTVTLRGDQSAEAQLTLGNIALTDAPSKQRIDITNASVSVKTAAINSASAPARLEFSLPSITSSQPSQLTIENLLFTSSITKQAPNDSLTLRQEARLGATTGAAPLRSGQWHIELSEINEESLTQFYAMLAKLQLLRGDSSPTAVREANDLNQRLGLLLLNNSLSIKSAFDLNAYDGDHRGEIKLRYGGLPQLRNIMGLNIKEAVAASTFSIDLDLDLVAVTQSPAREMLDPFVQQGYIVISNGRIKMNASLQDSIVELNGAANPVERFF